MVEAVAFTSSRLHQGRVSLSEELKQDGKESEHSLSGPPSLSTASTKRWWSSGVHRSRGLGSRDIAPPPQPP